MLRGIRRFFSPGGTEIFETTEQSSDQSNSTEGQDDEQSAVTPSSALPADRRSSSEASRSGSAESPDSPQNGRERSNEPRFRPPRRARSTGARSRSAHSRRERSSGTPPSPPRRERSNAENGTSAPRNSASPDLVPRQQALDALADAAAGYDRAHQPGFAPNRSHERMAWNAVFQADEDRITDAIVNYLQENDVNDLLARIASIHQEDEVVTRQRFARRYLDDLAWFTDDGGQNVRHQEIGLRRMLLDEIDLMYIQTETHTGADEHGVRVRLRSPEVDDFEPDDGLDQHGRLRLIQEAILPEVTGRPGQANDFRWGRLYLRLLRCFETADDPRDALQPLECHVPDHIRILLSQEGPNAVLHLGRMRTGPRSLAALFADWITATRHDKLPDFLLRSPIHQFPRRMGPTPFGPTREAEDTVTRRSRERLQRQLETVRAHVADLEGQLEDAQMDHQVYEIRIDGLNNEIDRLTAELGECQRHRREHEAQLAADRPQRERSRSSQRRPQRPTRPPPRREELGSEDELTEATPPPRPPSGSRPPRPSFDELYDLTPPRWRPEDDASRRSSSKRSRSSFEEDGRVPSMTPPGRRRRRLDHVAIPVVETPEPPAPPPPPAGRARGGGRRQTQPRPRAQQPAGRRRPAQPRARAQVAPSARVTRSMRRAGQGRLESGLK